jgi:leader peptidase (prepilin peptidase)/N-methyltransferase
MWTAPIHAVLIAAIGLVLLASSVVDVRSLRLPDRLTAAVSIMAVVLDSVTSLSALGEGIVAAALTFGLFETVRRGFLHLRRRPGLGFGDVKLAAALALWLGVATPWAVLAAAVGALLAMFILRPKDGRLAFGPALAAGGWLVGLAREAHVWPSLI